MGPAPAADAGRAGAAAMEPAAAQVRRDIAYHRAGGPTLDVHAAAGVADPAPAVLVLHGGGWSSGDKTVIAHVARAIADAGMVAVNVNYTLAAPGRRGFPTQLNELRAALRWVRRNAARIGVDPTRVGALGSSAGAHLAALLATTGRGRLTNGGRLGAVVSWSGPFDLRAAGLRQRVGGKIAGFLGCLACPRRAGAASPITHAGPGDPPMLLIGSRRELIPTSQAVRMSNRLRIGGVPSRAWILPGTLHAPRYAPTVLGPSIAYLRRRLR